MSKKEYIEKLTKIVWKVETMEPTDWGVEMIVKLNEEYYGK